MSRTYKFSDNDKLYFISFAIINWIDLNMKKTLLTSWRWWCLMVVVGMFLLSVPDIG